MKSKNALLALMAMSLTLASPAFADDNERQHDNGHGHRSQHDDNGGRHDDENRQQRDGSQARGGNDEQRGWGAGPNHNFHKGERLSTEYRHRNYVVDDWRGHNLSAPPRGYHWVQTGTDYVLVAVATGIILQILLSH